MKGYYLLVCMFLIVGLFVIGCEADVDEPEEVVDEPEEVVDEPEEVVDEPEEISIDPAIVSEIDSVIAELDEGAISEDEAVDAIKGVIPKPANDPDYPERSLEYVIGWGEGGGSDRYARNIGREAEKFLGQNFVYNNMPGAGSEIAFSYMQGQPSDGYTVFGTVTPNLINDAFDDVPYNFAEVATFFISNQGPSEALWVLTDGPFETIEDVVEYAKENPGELVYTGAAAKSESEMSCFLLNDHYGIDISYLGFEGAGERVSALLGEHADILYESVGPVIDIYRAGEVKPILYLGGNVFDELDPDVPTSDELGFQQIGRYRGIVGPVGVPADIAEYLYYVFYASSQMPDYKEYEKESHLHYSQPWALDPIDFEEFYERHKADIEEIIELHY